MLDKAKFENQDTCILDTSYTVIDDVDGATLYAWDSPAYSDVSKRALINGGCMSQYVPVCVPVTVTLWV